ncbi:MAG: redox-sensing transcriptional repressor Rex [Syntrophus sp. (in: bacteria)]|nr:redox-sensing transcriptional repressor Rex [Syntrophus sp. (in: bacteria)]
MAEIEEKKSEIIKAIPEPTLRRLPMYYQYLKRMHGDKKLDFISCTQIGNDLNVLPIQVRKDLQVADAIGKPKLGYSVGELLNTIEDFLGWNNTTDAYLVGVGNLGAALLGYQGFREYGLNIIAAFDTDDEKIGREIGGKRVLSASKLYEMIKRMSIKIGIITVPASTAQEIADIMVKAGIHAIWNFSPVKINAPPDIIVQHENLASSLGVLSKKLAMAIKANTDK